MNVNLKVYNNSLSSMHNLDDFDFSSEMTEPVHHNTELELFNQPPILKKVVSSINYLAEFQEDNVLEDLRLNEQKFVSHAKKLHDDNICPLGLRKNFGRVEFAQKHLFRNGF